MSRFYSEAYKWSLYERYRSGFTLTELQEISGITDKPLREWFRYFDRLYSRASSISLEEVHQKSAQLRKQFEKMQAELGLLQNEAVLTAVSESIRISCAQHLLKRYGPNVVCRSLKIRKSNLYYHTSRRSSVTVYEKHNLELLPAIREICGDSLKRIGAERVRQQLISQGFTVSKRKVLELFGKFPLGQVRHKGKATARPSGHATVSTYSPDDFPRQGPIWLGSAISRKFERIPASSTSALCWTYLPEGSLRHVFRKRKTLLS